MSFWKNWSTRKNGVRKIYGEIIGYGSTADAFRITDSHDEGRGAIACLKEAMEDAGISPSGRRTTTSTLTAPAQK
jgi:3-oxoacyl-(acyl-carrier-protein) synthase